jgi:hypothetical protein
MLNRSYCMSTGVYKHAGGSTPDRLNNLTKPRLALLDMLSCRMESVEEHVSQELADRDDPAVSFWLRPG